MKTRIVTFQCPADLIEYLQDRAAREYTSVSVVLRGIIRDKYLDDEARAEIERRSNRDQGDIFNTDNKGAVQWD